MIKFVNISGKILFSEGGLVWQCITIASSYRLHVTSLNPSANPFLPDISGNAKFIRQYSYLFFSQLRAPTAVHLLLTDSKVELLSDPCSIVKST